MFGDLASALSARAARAALALQKKHETRVRLAFRHLPPPADETSGLAARLAVAAAEAGRFWELGDRLFGEGGADRARVVAHAREMGLDPDAVDAEPERARLQRIVDRDAALARRLGVRATPTFYVNGRLVAGVQPWDRFQALLLAEMATAAELVRQGVSPADLYPRLVAHHRAGLQPVGDRPAAGEEERATIDLQWAPTVGPPRAAVTVVMFMDYVTSAGRQVRGLPEALRASWKGSVRVAVKFHAAGLATGGQPLAETALAAHAQGRFWSYHDRLLAGEPPLAEEDWLNHARAAGLDVARLRRDVAERRFAARARADMAESAQVRAWFSPTFFVNGRRLSGVQTIDTLRPVIEEELTRRAAAAAGRGGD
jgi:protein-disulfide isomerase